MVWNADLSTFRFIRNLIHRGGVFKASNIDRRVDAHTHDSLTLLEESTTGMLEKQWLSDAFATCYLDYLEDDTYAAIVW